MQVNANSMMAHSSWMGNNANNVANVNTEEFNASQTTIQNPAEGSVVASTSQTEKRTDLAKELTEQVSIEKGSGANVAAVKAYDEMIGSLIDLRV